MECPKCGFSQGDERLDCLRCGLIFAKYRPPEERPRPAPTSGAQPLSLKELLLTPPSVDSAGGLWARGVLLTIILGLSVPLILSPPVRNASGESVLHLINLPFHEAGHLLFRPLGRFLTSAGGSLFQLMVPLICLGALLVKTRDAFGASVCLWWHGENYLDLAPYIYDARAGVLPLLGGNTGRTSPYGFHDWEFLLTETGLLHWDHRFAWAAQLWGSLLMILALCWGVALLWKGHNQRFGKNNN